MKVIVGLGNDGGMYGKTYHNVGFMMIDHFAQNHGFTFTKKKFSSYVAEQKVDNENVVLLKPRTFMNNSGKAVAEIMHKFKLDPQDVMIVYDDIDLPVGKVRYRQNGSAGTHNGMRSVIKETGSTLIRRTRVGIGVDKNMELRDFVLSNINAYDKQKIDQSKQEVDEILTKFIKNELN